MDLLTKRFQTRFQAVKLMPPDTEALAAFPVARWLLPKRTADQIAVGSGEWFRAVLADLESWLNCQP